MVSQRPVAHSCGLLFHPNQPFGLQVAFVHPLSIEPCRSELMLDYVHDCSALPGA